MSSKQQTAVEWLALYIKGITTLNCDEVIAKAKAMEKEQISEAFLDGVYRASPSDLDYENFQETGEQYYNQNFL